MAFAEQLARALGVYLTLKNKGEKMLQSDLLLTRTLSNLSKLLGKKRHHGEFKFKIGVGAFSVLCLLMCVLMHWLGVVFLIGTFSYSFGEMIQAWRLVG